MLPSFRRHACVVRGPVILCGPSSDEQQKFPAVCCSWWWDLPCWYGQTPEYCRPFHIWAAIQLLESVEWKYAFILYCAGPKKCYRLNADERRVLSQAGFNADNSNMAWCFKHVLLKGVLFDVPPADFLKNLSCNCLFTTQTGGIFIINAIILYQQQGFIVGHKLSTNTSLINRSFSQFVTKVTSIGTRLKVVKLDTVLPYKYHLMLSEDGEFQYVAKVPNTCELE